MAETQVQDPGIKIEGEVVPGVEQKVEDKQPQYTEVEVRAIEQGWRPKEEWDGDPEDWRDAKTYIDRGELLGKLKNQKAELNEIKQTLTYMSEHNKRVYAAGYQKAIADLKAQRIAAMKDENFEAVAAIEEEIDSHKQALQDIQRQPTVKAPTIDKNLESDWLSKNSWYKTDHSMKIWANGMALDYKQTNREATEEEIYDFLSKAVRKEFPHKFKRVSPPSPDGEGRQTNSAKGGKGSADNDFDKLMGELPEEHARAAKSMVKSGLVTKEKYLEDYGYIGGR